MNSVSVVHVLPHQDHAWVCSWNGRNMIGIKFPLLSFNPVTNSASRSSQVLNFCCVADPSVRISLATFLLELSQESPPVRGLLRCAHAMITSPRSRASSIQRRRIFVDSESMYLSSINSAKSRLYTPG